MTYVFNLHHNPDSVGHKTRLQKRTFMMSQWVGLAQENQSAVVGQLAGQPRLLSSFFPPLSLAEEVKKLNNEINRKLMERLNSVFPLEDESRSLEIYALFFFWGDN